MSERDFDRVCANHRELVDRLAKAISSDGISDPLEGLRLARTSVPTERIYGVSRSSFCVIAQGAKEVTAGERTLRYDAHHYLIATVEMPVTGRIVEATKQNPYLSLRLDLDPAMVGAVMVEAGLPTPSGPSGAKAMFVSKLDAELLDATVRLVRLLDSPTEARVLMPMVKREIAFRLLLSEQGERVRHLPMLGAQSHRIAQAVQRLRKEFDRPISVEGLARELGMSPSGFHQHFRAVTDMSPLQFQKQLRLQEARRLMLSESLDASGAGYRVGYEDPSHFSRDYKKHFSHPPAQDAERLRVMATAE